HDAGRVHACQRTTSTQPTELDELAGVSFRLPFHQGLLGPSGAQRLDKLPDLTCKHSTASTPWTIRSCLGNSRFRVSSPGANCAIAVVARVRHPGALLPSVMAGGVEWPGVAVPVAAPAVASAPRPAPRTSLREVDVETWDAIRSRRNVRS